MNEITVEDGGDGSPGAAAPAIRRHRIRTSVLDDSDVPRRKAIGRRLREIRLACHLTQAELARGLGTKAWISALENGLVYPSLPSLYRIADRLDVPITAFLSDGPIDPAIEARANAKRVLQELKREVARAEDAVGELARAVGQPHVAARRGDA